MGLEDLSGQSHRVKWQVTDRMTVPNLLPHDSHFARYGQSVLATGYLLGLMEEACWALTVTQLATGQALVGSVVSMQHRAPSRPGDQVDMEVTCVGVAGRRLRWSAHALNLRTVETILHAEHELLVVDKEQFDRSVENGRSG